MSDNVSIEDFAKAINDLPQEYKSRLHQLTTATPAADEGHEACVDAVSIRFDLVKFASELRKHNQAIDWETNKQKPKKINPEDIILDAQKLFDFIVG